MLVVAGFNSSVTVGGQNCDHVRLISGKQIRLSEESEWGAIKQTINCVLLRNSTFGALQEVEVVVSVPPFGYACSNSSFIRLPTVLRGFELSSVQPGYGSVLGGNTLTLGGFGFHVDMPLQNSVLLSIVGLEPLSVYDELLKALGFPAQTVRLDYQVISCEVLSVSLTELTCLVPSHARPYADLLYNVSVTTNSIGAVCTGACLYDQSRLHTPTTNVDFKVVNVSMYNEYVLEVSGYLLGAGQLTIWIEDLLCEVLHVTKNDPNSVATVTFRTPMLTSGNQSIYAHVAGYGDALSAAALDVDLSIYDVIFSASQGSLAGGTTLTLTGKGFSRFCSQHGLFLTVLIDSATVIVPVTDLKECAPNYITALLPSILPKLSSSVRRLPASNVPAIEVVSVSVSVLKPNQKFNHTAVQGTAFSYALVGTPLVSVNATSGYAGDVLVLPMTVPVDYSLGNNLITVSVNHKTMDCTLLVSTLSCIVPPLPAMAAPYTLEVYFPGLGYAILSTSSSLVVPSFKSLLSITSFPSTIYSSSQGGLDIVVQGRGLSDDLQVSICDKNCTIEADDVSYGSLTCTVPARLTTNFVDELYSELDFEMDLIDTLAGTYFSDSNPSLVQNVSDGDYNTYYTSNSLSCFIGIRLPSGYRARPYRMRYYPRLRYNSYINVLNYEGSLDNGVTFVTLASTNGAHGGWNYIDVNSQYANSWFTHFRYRAVDSNAYRSRCYLAEVNFLGITAATSDTCSIVVSSADVGVSTNAGSLMYNNVASFTPAVLSLYPNNGTALGGDVVTITGTHFSSFGAASSTSAIEVFLSGKPCMVLGHDDTEITCVTSPRKPEDVTESSILVNIPGRGDAVVADNVLYQYIDKWSALTSWRNREPPVAGDMVWIPDGQVISLDVKTPVLTFLLVEGELHFDRNYDVSIDSTYILLLGGLMQVGTEDQPFEKSAVITLHGDRYTTIEIPVVGSKCLAVAAKGINVSLFNSYEF